LHHFTDLSGERIPPKDWAQPVSIAGRLPVNLRNHELEHRVSAPLLNFQWLCHADARQVYDLPEAGSLLLAGLRPRFAAVIDRKI